MMRKPGPRAQKPLKVRAAGVDATQDLTQTVSSFIDGKIDVSDVLERVSRYKHDGTGSFRYERELQARAADAAEDALKDVLRSRLRRTRSEAMAFGRKGLCDSHVDLLERVAQSTRQAGILDGDEEANLASTDELLKNMKVRIEMKAVQGMPTSGASPDAKNQKAMAMSQRLGSKSRLRMISRGSGLSRKQAAEDTFMSMLGVAAESATIEDEGLSHLVNVIKQHAKPAESDWEERLSDPTLATVARMLTKTIAGDWEKCRRAVRLGVLGFIRRIFLSDRSLPDAAPMMCGTEHPALTLALADVLAEVMLTGAREAGKRHEKLRSASAHGATFKNAFNTKQTGLPKRGSMLNSAPGGGGAWEDPFAQISRNVVQTTLIGEASLACDALMEAALAAQTRYEHALVWGVLTALRRAAEHHMCIQHLLLSGLQPLLRQLGTFYESCSERLPLPTERPKPKPPPTISPDAPDFPRPVAPALERCTETVKGRWLGGSASMPGLGGIGRQNYYASLGSPERQEPVDHMEALCGYGTPMWLACEAGDYKESFYRECSRSFILLRIATLSAKMENSKASLVQPLHRPRST